MEASGRPPKKSLKAPEELAAQLAFQLTNALNPKGFVMESRSTAGVVLRRRSGGLFIFGVILVIVGLLGAAGGSPEALVLAAIGALIVYLRRPATVAVTIVRDPTGGTLVTTSAAGQPGVERAVRMAL